MSRELLQNVRVLDPVSGTDRIADILIAEGNIKAVEEKIARVSRGHGSAGLPGTDFGAGVN